VPRWHLHPKASSHENTPSRDLLITHAPAIGTSHRGCLGHTPSIRLVPKIEHKILPNWLNPHHTPKTHTEISPSCYHIITTLPAPSALATHKQASTKHHIKDIMHSRSKLVRSKRASSLIVGVQGNRLRQGNGFQAFLPCNLSQFICIKVKHWHLHCSMSNRTLRGWVRRGTVECHLWDP
jgi:hypothetical protein